MVIITSWMDQLSDIVENTNNMIFYIESLFPFVPRLFDWNR